MQGNIDAAVNGGVAKYLAAFFTEEFISASPRHFGALERLAGLLAEHSSLLQVGLSPCHFGALERLAGLLAEHSSLLQVGLIRPHFGSHHAPIRGPGAVARPPCRVF